jgi:hypothetical protein
MLCHCCIWISFDPQVPRPAFGGIDGAPACGRQERGASNLEFELWI